MILTAEHLARLDWQNEHDAALEAEDTLNILHQIATDPESYTVAEFDAGYARAEELAYALHGMTLGFRAKSIAREFKRAAKAAKMCRKYDLVPRSKYDEICARLEQAKAARTSILSLEDVKTVLHPVVYIPSEGEDLEAIRARINACVAAKHGTASIGIGDPLPPPPPTKARDAWTGETLHKARWAHLGADATDWARLDQSTRDQYDAIADAVNRQSEIDAKASREPVPALTLDDLAEAWTSAAIGRVIGYGPSSELLAALNEALARKSQP